MLRNCRFLLSKACVLAGCAAVLPLFPAAAQQEDVLQKSMTLVKPYQPSVTDARREGAAPAVTDTLHLLPDFDYQFKPRQDRFALNAQMATPELPDEADTLGLNRGYVSSGAGNYFNRELMAGYRSLPNDVYTYGADFSHFSSSGKTKLANGLRVPSKHSDNRLDAFGSYQAERMRWDARIELARRVTHAFGYNVFTMPAMELSDNRSRYVKADAEVSMKSVPDAFRYKFDAVAGFQGIADNHQYRENRKYAAGRVSRQGLSIEASLDYVQRSSSFDTLQWVWELGTKARYTHEMGWFTVSFGAPLNLVKERDLSLKWRIWPEMEVIYRGWLALAPYAGLRGGVQVQTYHDLLEENPYLLPGTLTRHSYTPWNIYAGVQGQWLSGRLRYSAECSLLWQKHAPFYVNHHNGVENWFDVVTDNIRHFSTRGELSYQILPSLRLEMSGTYHAYSMDKQDKPWHKPSYTSSAMLKYNILRDWTVTLFCDQTGGRYGLMHIDGQPVTRKMDPVTLYGAEVTYHLLYNIDIYFKLNNMMAASYEQWLFYPAQKISYLIGSHYYFK